MTDAKCPVCGVINMCLNLEETDGRYICSICGSEIQITEYREKREAETRQRRRRERSGFLAKAKKTLVAYRGFLCTAIRERNEHFFEGLNSLTYVEYLLDCLEQCPEELYADKKAVKRIGEIERRLAGWDRGPGADGAVSG